MGVKDFLVRKLVESKLKHLPAEQREMIITLVTKNPEFFKKIQAQIETKKKRGINEEAAMMQVMRENEAQIKKLMMEQQGGKMAA